MTWYAGVSGEKIIVTGTGTEEPVEQDVYSDIKQRIQVLGALEGAVLQNYDFMPIMNSSSAGLMGMQIEYYLEYEVFPMGRGGIKYMTCNYDDAAWNAYVAETGGTLNYE